MTFARQLKAERERLGLTQGQAAALLELSRRWVEEVEAGRTEPKKVMQEGVLARLRVQAPPDKTRGNEI